MILNQLFLNSTSTFEFSSKSSNFELFLQFRPYQLQKFSMKTLVLSIFTVELRLENLKSVLNVNNLFTLLKKELMINEKFNSFLKTVIVIDLMQKLACF